MTGNRVGIVGVALAVCSLTPSDLFAEWYDEFYDNAFAQDPNDEGFFDPNLWECDNPHWTIRPFVGEGWEWSAEGGALRLGSQWLLGLSLIAAEVDDFDQDANTSDTWFDDSGPHYVLSYCISIEPNAGMMGVWMVFNHTLWTAYAHELEVNNGWMSLTAYSGTDYHSGDTTHRSWSVIHPNYFGDANYYDPNHPSDPNYVTDPNHVWDEWDPDHPDPNGFWLLLQFDPNGAPLDPNNQSPYDANDPNFHWIRGSFWGGGKYDWDGEWDLETCVVDSREWDPNTHHFTEGTVGVASFCGGNSGFPSDVAYDSMESRWGWYTNTSRKLTLKLKDCCELHVCPDLLEDPNHDPNDIEGELRRYTLGTAIVLDSVLPCGNKVFKKWIIKGPNDASDPGYQVVTDTNEVLYLTMDGDYLVKATCKCGGGGVEPFAVAVLALLGLGGIIRRLT